VDAMHHTTIAISGTLLKRGIVLRGCMAPQFYRALVDQPHQFLKRYWLRLKCFPSSSGSSRIPGNGRAWRGGRGRISHRNLGHGERPIFRDIASQSSRREALQSK
jgi:hypothetical protein